MPRRNGVLATNEKYHIFNRTVGTEFIFLTKWNLRRIIDIVDYYRFPQTIRYSKFIKMPDNRKEEYYQTQIKQVPLVEIFANSFMPNHYHFLLEQLRDNGISQFISNTQNSFAKFFNLKKDRHGTLFQNPFKSKRIESEEQFIHVSRYIHLNPVTAYLIEFEKLFDYPWTSFQHYMGQGKNRFINTKLIFNHFGSKEKYAKFVADNVDYQRQLKYIEHLMVD